MEPLKDFIRQMPISNNDFKKKSSRNYFLGLDPVLLILLLVLTIVGIFVLYSAAGQNMGVIYRQLVYLGLGYCVMLVVSQLSLEIFKIWAPLIYIAGCFVLFLVLVIGVGAKGAQRWIDLGIVRFQPSELLKLAVPMLVAWYLSRQILPPNFKDICIVFLIVCLPAALIMAQPDLGTAVLVSVSGLFVLWLSGLRLAYIIGAFGMLVVAAYPMWMFVLHDYQKKRILTLLNPDSDKLGAGWNIIQSKTAIGSGGMYGKGWLDGTQSQLDFLPESHTDFIIAVLAEEHGLVGVLVLLAIYLMITLRGLYISWRADSVFAQLLGGAITLTFFFYVFVNIGMVSGILPVVGVPLPLVSQGGTSIVSLLLGFGVLMIIAKHKRSLEDRKQ